MGRVSIGAAVLAAILLLCTYITHPLPRFVAKPLGVHQGDFAEHGGIAFTWEAPTVDEDRLRPIENALRERNDGGAVWREGRTFQIIVMTLPSSSMLVSPDDVSRVVERMTRGGGLTFHEALVVPEMAQLADLVPRENFKDEQWRPEDVQMEPIRDYYLFAPTEAELDRLFADARAKGWSLPPGTHIAYEHVDDIEPENRGVRSYVVRDEAALDGMDIASAMKSYDPNTNRPIVLLDFTREGSYKFAEVTERIVGYKLATMVNGRVRSAPVINGPIRGGRASITMGGYDAQSQEREAEDLVEVLRIGTLPPGGTVSDARYIAPSASPMRTWLARILLALAGALAIGGLVVATLRFARPEKRPLVRVASGSPPWSRLAVMLVAPIAVFGVQQVAMFGVNEVELMHIFARSGNVSDIVSIGALGIMPVMTAYVVVETVALILPSWRRRRNAGPIARQPITLAAALVTVLLLVYQGWNLAEYFGRIDGILHPGMLGKILVISSVAAGTLILIIAAEIIRWRGLGNGYGAILATGWLISLWESFDPVRQGLEVPAADRLVQLAGCAVIAIVFLVALRWRVRDRGEHALRFPSSSFAPLADAGGVVAFMALASQLPLDELLFKAMEWVQHVHTNTTSLLSMVAALAMIWSFAFARPAAFAGVAKPSAMTWARATSISLVALVLVAAVSAFVTSATRQTTSLVSIYTPLVETVMIAITVAVILDAIEDFRARRQKLVVAWTLHQPHHADVVQNILAADGIHAHMSASYLRSLLSFFGPFVPIEVQVPEEHAQATRAKLERLAAEAG